MFYFFSIDAATSHLKSICFCVWDNSTRIQITNWIEECIQIGAAVQKTDSNTLFINLKLWKRSILFFTHFFFLGLFWWFYYLTEELASFYFVCIPNFVMETKGIIFSWIRNLLDRLWELQEGAGVIIWQWKKMSIKFWLWIWAYRRILYIILLYKTKKYCIILMVIIIIIIIFLQNTPPWLSLMWMDQMQIWERREDSIKLINIQE